MNSQPESKLDPADVLERLRAAINRHDLDALVACFHPDFSSDFPAHPDRAFRGHEQQRRNWAGIFATVPDIEAALVRRVSDGDTAWAEWEYTGTRADGVPFAMRGVTIQEVRSGKISWSRLYMEPVEDSGAGIDAAVRQDFAGSRTRPEEKND